MSIVMDRETREKLVNDALKMMDDIRMREAKELWDYIRDIIDEEILRFDKGKQEDK